MTFAEKLKNSRKSVGLSQEQLAEKLCVSRQAVTKWESGRGIPDIENIKAISKLLDVSIDYLLDDGQNVDTTVMKEAINLDDYSETGKLKCREHACVVAKYPDAKKIYNLVRQRKFTIKEEIVDFIFSPGVLNVADQFRDNTCYYLVEMETGQILVNVTKEFIISTPLPTPVTDKKFMVGDNKFYKGIQIV